MKNPTICGNNFIYLPGGCGDDCGSAISEEDIIALTPIECYEPFIEDLIVCSGRTCQSRAGCIA